MTDLSHVDASGAARMVDVSEKPETHRLARATGRVLMAEATRDLLARKALPKGDVLTVAKIAGILAAKKCGELIPMCHPIPLTDVQVEQTRSELGVEIPTRSPGLGLKG